MKLKCKINCFLLSFALKFNSRRYSEALSFMFDTSADGRGLHSSTYRLKLSTFSPWDTLPGCVASVTKTADKDG